jgi:ABC-type phosphate transport system permease subunit
MSQPTVPPLEAPPPVANASGSPKPSVRSPRGKSRTSLLAHGLPLVWLNGGALAVCLCMIIGLLVLVLIRGTSTFWPAPLVEVKTVSGKRYLGEVIREDRYRPEDSAFEALPPEARAKAREMVKQNGDWSTRRMLFTANFDLTGTDHYWVSDFEIAEESQPEWALFIERDKSNDGRFIGLPRAFLMDGKEVADTPAEVWAQYTEHHDAVRKRVLQRERMAKDDMGAVRRREQEARLAMREAELKHGAGSPEHVAATAKFEEAKEWADREQDRLTKEIATLDRENDRYKMRLASADGKEKVLPLSDIVRAYPANQLGFWAKLGVYKSRWWEFLSGYPRNSNTEGGVLPAIWGTAAMTMLLTIFVVPFGVLAALYLREYAKPGPVVSAVRIAVNNLAGVPSIVFGVFGLGFFCYIIGGFIDGGPANIGVIPWPSGVWFLFVAVTLVVTAAAASAWLGGSSGRWMPTRTGILLRRASIVLWVAALVLALMLIVKAPFFHGFFRAKLLDGESTFGSGGVLWASLTLALLTLPVVIVATEEALAAVPSSMREGSYACGASKWQTIRRIVLPRAMPGIMTGMILAMARGAGEVAPIMLTGAKKAAANLPMDGVFPYIHPSYSFMHLGFHIYDVSLQSRDSESAKPIVFTTTLLLIALIALLNLTAMRLRARLRRRYAGSQF